LEDGGEEDSGSGREKVMTRNQKLENRKKKKAKAGALELMPKPVKLGVIGLGEFRSKRRDLGSNKNLLRDFGK
jgi:hypothetical protein